MDDSEEKTTREQKERVLQVLDQINDNARKEAFQSLLQNLPPHHPEIFKFQQEWTDEKKKYHEDRRVLMQPMNDLHHSQSAESRPVSMPAQDERKPSTAPFIHTVLAGPATSHISGLSHPTLQVDRSTTLVNTRANTARSATTAHHIGEDDRVAGCPMVVKLSSDISDRGWVELRCPLCGANSSSSESRSYQFWSGVAGVRAHLIKEHDEDASKPEGGWITQYVIDHCVFRQLSHAEVVEIKAVITKGENPIKRLASGLAENSVGETVLSNPTATMLEHDVEQDPITKPKAGTGFDGSSNPERFPYHRKYCIVVKHEDGTWVELRCPVCGGNSGCNGEFYRGLAGLEQHIRKVHRLKWPEGVDKWEWLLRECCKWTLNPVVNPQYLRPGDIPHVLSKSNTKRKARSDIDDSILHPSLPFQTNVAHDQQRALSEGLERVQLSNKRQRPQRAAGAATYIPQFEAHSDIEQEYISQPEFPSAQQELRQANVTSVANYSQGNTPASPEHSWRTSVDRFDIASALPFTSSRPSSSNRPSTSFARVESSKADLPEQFSSLPSITDSPVSARPRYHPQPRIRPRNMTSPAASVGKSPVRTQPGDRVGPAKNTKAMGPPSYPQASSPEAQPRRKPTSTKKNQPDLRRVCPCTLSGHLCKTEGGCGRLEICIGIECRTSYSPGCRSYHGLRPTCGEGCPTPKGSLLDGLMESGQCPYGHDAKDERLRIKAEHRCFNH